MRRIASVMTVVFFLTCFALLRPGAARAATPVADPGACRHPVLVLSAMPLELSPLVAAARLDPARTVHVDGRVFYAGSLAGGPVVMAVTRIGVVNAEQTTTDALRTFHCPFRAVVFSGVAGSTSNLGDVAIPARWTLDGGRTWMTPDPGMFRAASALARPGQVRLEQSLPTGDAACLCEAPDVATPVHVAAPPQVRVGGEGRTTDPFGGYSIPCVPGGGDITGCEPCILSGDPAYDVSDFARRAPADVTPGFIAGVIAANSAPGAGNAAASDEETAAVATVAGHHRIPFLGIRGVSDGAGDPLHLPGFPSQFLVYRQLAADNAAAVTIAFLHRWAAASSSPNGAV